MNIYTAIMKAADSIEQNPQMFNFDSVYPPKHGCGTPGCALGWIGLHLGVDERMLGSFTLQVGALLGFPGHSHVAHPFYKRMQALTGGQYMTWRTDAKLCAKGLRLYAAKYHAPAHTGLPDIVRDIFTGHPRQIIRDDVQDQRFA